LVEASGDDLKKLLKRLHPDPDVAWEMYFTLWRKLVTSLEHRNCPSAQDEAHEVLGRIARRHNLDAIENIEAFAYGVIKMMRFEIPDKQKRELAFDETLESKVRSGQNEDPETEIVVRIDRERKVKCFLHCLAKLTTDDRDLILSFKLAEPETRTADRRKLAEKRGVTEGTLRVRVHRIRRNLELCARKCLKTNAKLSPNAS
jgi:DNA-directed RNA polymerase specialized sigma24 family protein